MVEVKERKTDFRSIFRDFFGVAGISKEREEKVINQWETDNADILSMSNGNIRKLEKMLVYNGKRKRKSSDTRESLKAEPINEVQKVRKPSSTEYTREKIQEI